MPSATIRKPPFCHLAAVAPGLPASVRQRFANRAASNAVRSAMRSIRILSLLACAPSPTPPKPSSVGTPSAAVKFPSEPPPVADSSSFQAQAAPHFLRFAEQFLNRFAPLHRRPVQATLYFNRHSDCQQAAGNEISGPAARHRAYEPRACPRRCALRRLRRLFVYRR